MQKDGLLEPNHLTDRKNKTKGIFYFLGHLPHHLSHGLFLDQHLGGEWLVTTNQAKSFCEKRGLPVRMLDECSEEVENWKPSCIPCTLDYLNRQEGVLFFFDIFPGMGRAVPALMKIMLFHGNSLKAGWFKKWRVRSLKRDIDFMTTLGPYWERLLREKGIPGQKYLRIGQTRSDVLMKSLAESGSGKKEDFFHLLNVKPAPVVTYMPTWYGISSVERLGKEIVRSVSDEYILVFRPHPETPARIIEEYQSIMQHRPNVIFLSEEKSEKVSLAQLFLATDIFISDLSSLVVEAILTDRPIMFTVQNRVDQLFRMWDPALAAIRHLYATSQKIGLYNINRLHIFLKRELNQKVNAETRASARRKLFHQMDGSSTRWLVQFVQGLKNSKVEG